MKRIAIVMAISLLILMMIGVMSGIVAFDFTVSSSKWKSVDSTTTTTITTTTQTTTTTIQSTTTITTSTTTIPDIIEYAGNVYEMYIENGTRTYKFVRSLVETTTTTTSLARHYESRQFDCYANVSVIFDNKRVSGSMIKTVPIDCDKAIEYWTGSPDLSEGDGMIRTISVYKEWDDGSIEYIYI